MEAIKEAVQAAENYLWGNEEASKAASGEEPLAGVRGKGTAADPYDAGNAPKDVALEHAEEYAAQMKKEKEEEAAAQEQEKQRTGPGSLVSGSGSSTTPAGGQVRTTEPLRTEPDIPVKNPPAEASVASTNTHSETTSMPTISPSPAGGLTMSTKSPTEKVPSRGIPPSPIQASTVTAGDTGGTGKGSGKGSERITIATDAGPATRMPPFQGGGKHVPSPQNVGATNAHSHSQAQNTQPEEHYIHSTGYAAEGGDFDAAEPGAGREADRLLVEHHQEVTHGKKHADKQESTIPTQQSKPSSGPRHEDSSGIGDSSNKNKTSSHHHSMSHLKEKLHIGKHRS